MNRLVDVKTDLVYEAVESLLVENSLHSAEDGLDGVQFGAVADVENGFDIKLLVKWPYVNRPMDSQIIHEER